MKLQEALNYRSTCFIHQQPMRLYVRPEMRTYDIEYQQTENGISLWRKGNKPLAGAQLNFDGTFFINRNQSNLSRFLNNSSVFGNELKIGMMCQQCRSVAHINKGMERGELSLSNIRSSVHFYTFLLHFQSDNLSGNYNCSWGIEAILYHSEGKLYHLSGSIGGGPAAFHMGNCNSKMKVGKIIDSLFSLQTPQFDPSRLQTLEQMVEKIKIYNLFS